MLECIDVNVLDKYKKMVEMKRELRSIPLNLDPNVKGQGCLLSLKVNGVELIKKGESNAVAA